jgi:hypothetical protein
VREVPKRPLAQPNPSPDAGAYPDGRDRPPTRAREIDCSVADAERRSAAKAGQNSRPPQETDKRKADVKR